MGISPQEPSILLFETVSHWDLKPANLSRLALLANPRDSLVPVLPSLGLQSHVSGPSSLRGPGDQNQILMLTGQVFYN